MQHLLETVAAIEKNGLPLRNWTEAKDVIQRKIFKGKIIY